jgi:anti-sigma-K factor RskA
MADHDEHRLAADAAAYVLGALPPEEAAAFEAALANDPALQREVAALREVTLALAESTDATVPSAGLRDRVISRTLGGGTVRGVAPTPAASRLPTWFAIAAGLAAVAFGAAWLQQRAENRSLVTMAASLQRDLGRTQTRLASSQELLDVILAPDMRVDLVQSTGTAQPQLRLFRDPARHVAIAMAQDLKPAPAGRTYQLWWIRDGVPVPSITFNPGADGRIAPLRVEMPAGDGTITAAAVTEEPAGGSPAPTTTPFMVGALTE